MWAKLREKYLGAGANNDDTSSEDDDESYKDSDSDDN